MPKSQILDRFGSVLNVYEVDLVPPGHGVEPELAPDEVLAEGMDSSGRTRARRRLPFLHDRAGRALARLNVEWPRQSRQWKTAAQCPRAAEVGAKRFELSTS